jgi:hypothetical protein
MKPKLRTPMLLLAGAALAWTLSGMIASRPWMLLVQAIMFLMGAAALYTGLFHFAHSIADLVKAANGAKAAGSLSYITALTNMLQVTKTMSDAQLAAIGRLRPEIEHVPGNGVTPIHTLLLPAARIPWDFVDEFYAQCTETHLAPVRRWSNGSKKHDWADAITAHMIDAGYAVYNPGNESTTWVSEKQRLAGWESIGIEE